MLNEFCNFIYELESIYIKELDSNLILNFIEKFYRNFCNKNSKIEPHLLNITANTIVVAVDSILLKKGAISGHWIHRTAERYLLNMNRGNEVIDNTIRDLTTGTIVNQELNTIVMMLLMSGVDSPYRKEFIEFFNGGTAMTMNIEKNLKISTINREKRKKHPLLYIFITTILLFLIITEIYYFVSLQSIVKSSGDFLLSVRSIYGV